MVTAVAHTPSYQAAWPKHLDPALQSLCTKIKNFMVKMFLILVFPIGLAYLGFCYLKSLLFKKLIFPGHTSLREKEDRILKKFGGDRLPLTSPDGAKLEGAFFPGKIRKKVLVYGFGNMQDWADCGGMLQLLKSLDVSIAMVNPRGVNRSKGSLHEEGYPLDCYTLCKYLIDVEKIDPNDIVMMGHSMGGALVTLTAEMLEKEYPDKKINVVNSRSFSNLTYAAAGFLSIYLPLDLSLMATLIPRFRMNVTEAAEKLRGRLVIFHSPEDDVIPFWASLYTSMQNNTHRTGETRLEKISGHHNEFNEKEQTILIEELRKMLRLQEVEE